MDLHSHCTRMHIRRFYDRNVIRIRSQRVCIRKHPHCFELRESTSAHLQKPKNWYSRQIIKCRLLKAFEKLGPFIVSDISETRISGSILGGSASTELKKTDEKNQIRRIIRSSQVKNYSPVYMKQNASKKHGTFL